MSAETEQNTDDSDQTTETEQTTAETGESEQTTDETDQCADSESSDETTGQAEVDVALGEYMYPTDLNDFKLAAMGVIRTIGEPYGLEVMRGMEALLGTDINPGHLYPNLDELAEKGLVHIESKDGRTNLYVLTKRGEMVLAGYRAFVDDIFPDPRS